MKSLLEELIRIFEAHTDLHRSLISVLMEEKDAITNANLFELTKASYEKTNLILKIRKQEDQRAIIHADLANTLGKTPQKFTLKKLCRLIDN